MAEEKKVTETTTKTQSDTFGEPKEQKTTTETKEKKDLFGDVERTTETTTEIED